ncbi:MAG TPA: glycoside hydrolase family 18 protein [Flavisolibacter sp.]|nr:glycoside hydrolase family 18 protein [Flavisolibacter sp.]
MRKLTLVLCICLSQLSTSFAYGQTKDPFPVIAYYSGKRPSQVDSFEVEKLTHIIFSFCHLEGARLQVDRARDTIMIEKLVSLKKRNPDLKVMLSLGGWGGCATCSDVFSSKENRRVFAESVKELNGYFGTDGIDLDWEYPTIPGYPGHKYQQSDKKNFTKLVKQLRKTLGKDKEISFAAGGFSRYIDEAVEWKKIMKDVDRVNLMTYDLVHGFSTSTGHHTPLYSTNQQTESINNAVEKLIALKVPRRKIVIGAAFYGRMWEAVADTNTGLYQKGRFKASIPFKNFASYISADSGFVYNWDEVAMAPYSYNPKRQLFVTYDDKRSMSLKTKYAIENGLGGIMFWELTEDTYNDGLLDAIDENKSMRK